MLLQTNATFKVDETGQYLSKLTNNTEVRRIYSGFVEIQGVCFSTLKLFLYLKMILDATMRYYFDANHSKCSSPTTTLVSVRAMYSEGRAPFVVKLATNLVSKYFNSTAVITVGNCFTFHILSFLN